MIEDRDDNLGDRAIGLSNRIMMIYGEAQSRYKDVEFPRKKGVNQPQSMHTERQFLTTKLTWLIFSGAETDLDSRVLSRSEKLTIFALRTINHILGREYCLLFFRLRHCAGQLERPETH